MYVPEDFKIEDESKIDEFIKSHPFVTIISVQNNFPIATHIPIVAKNLNDVWTIEGHISKNNEQFAAIQNNRNALCIFQGADAYISSSVYSHENVPTWNYQAIHLSGIQVQSIS